MANGLDSARPHLSERFRLVDHHGRSCDRTTFAGKMLLVYFGFTHCKVVCPASLGKLSRVIELLGDGSDELVPLYITVDPERDTPEVMRRYLEENYPGFIGMTGAAEDIEQVKADFRVFAGYRVDPEDPEGYERPHTAFAYLIDGAGRYLQHFPEAQSAEQIADGIAAQLRARSTLTD